MNSDNRKDFDLALSTLKRGELAEAASHFQEFLAREPSHLPSLNLLGIVLIQLRRYEEAETTLSRALKLSSASDATFYNYGIVLQHLGRFSEALEAFDRAAAIDPNVAETWNNRGVVLNGLRQYEDAVRSFERALGAKPDYADALSNLGKALFRLGRLEEALAACEKAVAIAPQSPEGWRGYASVLRDLERMPDALNAVDTALALDQSCAAAWMLKGNILTALKKDRDALDAFDRAISLQPDFDGLENLEGARLYLKLSMFDWMEYDNECAGILSRVRQGKPAISPFIFLALPSSPEDQLQCAKACATNFVFQRAGTPQLSSKADGDRIKVAYLSADFRHHAVGHLVAGLIERHDRKRFEIFGFSLGKDDNSPQRDRIKASFDHFIDGFAMPDAEIASRMREARIDIAVDLTGHTKGARPNILAARPAPVQVNYLGYAGTFGADFFDYIVADRIVIPEEERAHYSEQVVYLPDTYFVSDGSIEICEPRETRTQLGLPEDGFVFCCFVNNQKITPAMFSRWMNILRRVPGSVLWLVDRGAGENLRAHAAKAGVSPERLVFSPQTDFDSYIARHKLADLFLDTLPFNAHTTASHALWTGLPVLTMTGNTMAGRGGASLLNALGLNELIVHSHEEYEELAVALATGPERLRSVRERLAQNRLTSPLFDTKRFAANLETAFTEMLRRSRAGEPPESFSVREPNVNAGLLP